MLFQWVQYIVISFLYIPMIKTAISDDCKSQGSQETCEHLQSMMRSLDQTVSPCDDFYGHICGNLDLMVGENTHYRTILEFVDYQFNMKLIDIVESLANQSAPILVYKQAYDYYRSCVGAGEYNNILSYLNAIKPAHNLKWPLLYKTPSIWPDENFDPFALEGTLQRYGIPSILIRLEVYKSDRIGVVHTNLKNPFLFRQEELPQDYMIVLMQQMHARYAQSYAVRLKKWEQFWKQEYSKFTSSPARPYSYMELCKKYPYLNSFFVNYKFLKFPENSTILLHDEDYFNYLLTKEWEVKEKRYLCSYIMFKMLIYLLASKAERFTKLGCIQDLRDKMELATSLLYYEYVHGPAELKLSRTSNIMAIELRAMFDQIRNFLVEQYEKEAQNYDQKKLAQKLSQKFRNMRLNQGNMPRNMNEFNINEIFADISDMGATNYYSNQLNLLEHRVKMTVTDRSYKINAIFTDNRWTSTSEPYYDDYHNVLIVPLGIFQTPIYHPKVEAIFKWPLLQYLLVRALVPDVTVALQISYLICKREKSLQMNFNDISWEKLFFQNIASYYCVQSNSKLKHKNALLLRNTIMHDFAFGDAYNCSIKENLNEDIAEKKEVIIIK